MRVIGKILASAAMALAVGMVVEANAVPAVSGMTADSQVSLVAAKKAEAKKPEAKKAEPAKTAAKKVAKKKVAKAFKPCGVGKYHKKGKCVDAATNPVTPKAAKKAKK